MTSPESQTRTELYNYFPHHYYWQAQVVIKFMLAHKNVAQWKR